jgi:hypothetical protein
VISCLGRQIFFFVLSLVSLSVALSGIETKDQDWSFFSPQHLKSRNGNRLNRATRGGYWKVTGKDQEILSGARSIGKKKILVFYEGRTPNGKNTDWVTHEYHLSQEELDGNNPDQVGFLSRLLLLLASHFFSIALFLLANFSW